MISRNFRRGGRRSGPRRRLKKPKKIAVIFFETCQKVEQQKESLQQLCETCDQLNVVVEEESDMDNPSILGIHPKIKLYAGAAWFLVHQRRQDDGWYDQPESV